MESFESIKRHFLAHTVIALLISITAYSLVFVPIGRSQDGASNDNRSGPPQQVPAGGMAVEQKSPGTRSKPQLAESFDGLGFGFEGPQGKANLHNHFGQHYSRGARSHCANRELAYGSLYEKENGSMQVPSR